jgi:thymidylate synthase (FAD)
VKVLDKGEIRLIEVMGSDQAIVDAARVSYQKGTRSVRSDRNLIRYLMRHQHWTPFEMVEMKFRVKAPIFVIIQWLRHRTANVNSESGRYSVLENEYYIPEPERIQKQAEDNKQGSGECLPDHEAQIIYEGFREEVYDQHLLYQRRLELGVARELARINLPLSQYMSFYWKCDLRNIFNFLKLRLDHHAQEEIRVYADVMARYVKDTVPLAYEAFEDYILGAQTFSGKEMEILKHMVNDSLQRGTFDPWFGLNVSDFSKREKSEFWDKLGHSFEEN